MAKINFEETFEIYLFTDNQVENNFSKLSEFLAFLKFNKINLPYRFSYVGNGNGLIPELTLNENILMDFSPDSLTDAREIQFQNFLRGPSNHNIEKLYQKLLFPHEVPSQSDPQMQRVASLLKSLIFEGQFIFLESPEQDLDQECMSLFIRALKEHMARYKQNVFIFSHNLNLWIPHAHQLVRREKNFLFHTEKITTREVWKKEREQFFHSIKTNRETTPTTTPPIFHLPTTHSRKKIAS